MYFRRLLAILALCLCAAVPAQAKGLFIINTGDEMFEVGSFPAEVVQTYPGTKAYKAGYKCSHFGILWADVWTWDCQLVAVTGDNSYADLPDAVVSKMGSDPLYAMGKAQRSVWNHYGVLLLVLAGIAYLAYTKMGGKKKEAGDTTPHAAA